jgi:putative transposase
MPARNVIRIFAEDSYYHLYNRGVEKRLIFQDFQDYAVFMSYLKHYLSPPFENKHGVQSQNSDFEVDTPEPVRNDSRLRNYNSELQLVAYSLMPNHYHLLVKQKTLRAIEQFMSSLSVRYTMYFNRKNERVGTLFQGVYRAVPVESDEQLLSLTRYIHKQALSFEDDTIREIQPCSFGEYIGKRNTGWVHPEGILEYFSNTNSSDSYHQFVKERMEQDIENNKLFKKLTLE